MNDLTLAGDLDLVSHPDAIAVTRMIGGLAETLGEPITDLRIEGYLLALADVPLEDLRLGFQRAMAGAKWFPKPAEIRAHVDAAIRARAMLSQAAPGVMDEYDPRGLVHCQACHDVGWVLLDPDQHQGKNYARRCFCYTTNPALRVQRSYSEQERTR